MNPAPSGQKPSRPSGVTIVGVVAIAGGILSLLGGVMVLSGMATGPVGLAVIVLAFGFLGLGLGTELILGKPWARISTIIVYLLSIPLGIAEIFYGGNVGEVGGIIRTVAGILVPIYLSRPSPRGFCQRK
jgi:hypothetical protein